MSERDNIGYLSFVLHCHLPYVRHPEHDHFLEENWFFEAVTETYLPLLEVLEDVSGDGIPVNVTISISPPLLEMLTDDLLQERCGEYVRNREKLMEEELERKKGTEFESAVCMYLQHFRDRRELYGDHAGELFLAGLRRLWKQGHIELITSSATHAILPLLETSQAVYAQIEQGLRCFEKHFGQRPNGLWLPECAWSPELDRPLKLSGVEYCFLESHGVLLANPKPIHGVFAPIITPHGVAGFGRDVESSKQVWSADEGYPGDPMYREFHRDLGHDAPYEQVAPYLDTWGDRHELGVKYYRVTGDVSMEEKEPYDPNAAYEKVEVHAKHFVKQRCKQVEDIADDIGRKPIITAPYDAELFGHWWYEGPQFLNLVFREMATEPAVELISATEYLDENPIQQRAMPGRSTWGYEGYFQVWLNDSNDWVHRELQKAEREMVDLAREFEANKGLLKRALNQCARELLLAQSSDWPFLISTDGADDYATDRVKTHLKRFWKLAGEVRDSSVDRQQLDKIEGRDNIFFKIDYQLFREEG